MCVCAREKKHDSTNTLSNATQSMLAKRSNTSPPLIRSPCLAPAHRLAQKEVKIKSTMLYPKTSSGL